MLIAMRKTYGLRKDRVVLNDSLIELAVSNEQYD